MHIWFLLHTDRETNKKKVNLTIGKLKEYK